MGKVVPLKAAAAAVRKLPEVLAAYEHQLVRHTAHAAMRKATGAPPSPFLTGLYRSSHRISSGEPRGAQLGELPSYPVPGAVEVEEGLRGRRPGEVAYLTNDAGAGVGDGYVYATNVEDEGWKNTPPYKVYAQVLDDLPSEWDSIEVAAAAEAWKVAEGHGW